MNQTKLHKYSRSVSIIGVGCTPFMYTVDKDETNGLTEGEMYGYAALKAMEDAGVNPQDVDYYFHGQANPLAGSNFLTPNIQIGNWFGMKGKGSIHHSEACCTGYLAIEQAVNAVASGKYNCVLTGCVEFGDSSPAPYDGIPMEEDGVDVPKHPYKRNKIPMEQFLKTTSWLYDRTYTRALMAGQELIYDDAAEWYVRTRGITPEQMNDTLNWMCINNMRNAEVNPLSLINFLKGTKDPNQFTYDERAKAAGMTLDEYMNSAYNPRMGDFLRAGGIELKCDGAAACIVCATEMIPQIAKNLKHKPIEVVGIGSAACEASTPHFEVAATQEAVRQVYELTGMSGDDLDLFYANDFIVTSHLVSAEIAGYLPEGEGWKYICDGRTAWNGDKPINSNGGRTAFGHAHAASGMADMYEACKQIWNEAGDHQVPNLKDHKVPQTAMLRGYGGAQNVAAIIIKRIDD